MDVTPLAPAAASQAIRSTSRLAETFDTFLLLLTTQLQNQDPLEPMDTESFTEQLVQFAGVEQAIATNSNLEVLLALIEADQFSSTVNYLGKTVIIDGDTALLEGGEAQWTYTLAEDAASTTITITNEAGDVVFSSAGETAAGTHTVIWDALDDNGNPQPEGIYAIEVSATDSDGNAVAVTTAAGGIVSAIETVDGQQMLVVGNTLVPLSAVNLVMETAPEEL